MVATPDGLENYKDLDQESREGEQWRDIEGYQGGYLVSNFGRVRSCARKDSIGRGVAERIMRQTPNPDGYMQVALSVEGKAATLKMHRVVATAFHPNPNNLPEVHHRDEVKSNNTTGNLEWITRGDNVRASIHQLEKSYLFVEPNGGIIHVKGLRAFCRETELSPASMRKVDNLETPEHKGYRSPFFVPESIIPLKLSGHGNPWMRWGEGLVHNWSSKRGW